MLTAGVLLWHVAIATGTIDNIERFFEGFGWESFQFKGGEIFHNAWIAGLFVAVGLTGLAVLLATLFNLITDLVGGVRVQRAGRGGARPARPHRPHGRGGRPRRDAFRTTKPALVEASPSPAIAWRLATRGYSSVG